MLRACLAERSSRPAPERPAIVRDEWPCPRQLLHMDVKKSGAFTEPGHAVTGDRTRRSRRVGWEYWHSIVDDSQRPRQPDSPHPRPGGHRAQHLEPSVRDERKSEEREEQEDRRDGEEERQPAVIRVARRDDVRGHA